MNIEDVRAFVAVVDNGSVGKAALRLHLTQPAISRRVQRLEEALGVTLLDRVSKPARPTRAGTAAYQRCLEILRATDALARETGGAAPAMPLRVGLSYAISECVFAPALDALHRMSPPISLHLVAESSKQLRKSVEDGALDAAVVAARSGREPEGHRVAKLGEERVAVVAAKDSALPAVASISDLTGECWVINPDGCGFRSQLEQALADKGAPLNVLAETWGNTLQLAMVARGAGVGLVPERLLHVSPYRSRVRIIDVRGFRPKLSICMVRSEALSVFDQALDAMASAVKAVLSGTQVRQRRMAQAG
jgi:DNA-binding transcriptional LysR family regulator